MNIDVQVFAWQDQCLLILCSPISREWFTLELQMRGDQHVYAYTWGRLFISTTLTLYFISSRSILSEWVSLYPLLSIHAYYSLRYTLIYFPLWFVRLQSYKYKFFNKNKILLCVRPLPPSTTHPNIGTAFKKVSRRSSFWEPFSPLIMFAADLGSRVNTLIIYHKRNVQHFTKNIHFIVNVNLLPRDNLSFRIMFAFTL